MLALPPSLLHPALSSSLRCDGSPGEAEIAGALQLCAPLSGQLFTPKGPQTNYAQSETRTVVVTALFVGISFLLDSKEPWELMHPPLPQNSSCNSGFPQDRVLPGRLPLSEQSDCPILWIQFQTKHQVRETGRSLQALSLRWYIGTASMSTQGMQRKGCSPLPPPQEHYMVVYTYGIMRRKICHVASLLGLHSPHAECGWERNE